jgi:transposase
MTKEVGRPTKLTPERMEQLVNLVRAGNYIEQACCAVGISKSSYYVWKARGEEDKEAGNDTEYSQFMDAMNRAESEAEALCITTITKAEKDGDWRAAAWKLERKNHQRWGPVQRTTVKAEHSGEIKITLRMKP